MRVFKVSVMVDNIMQLCDGIEYEGKLWLIALSSANKSEGLRRIDRLVRFDILPHQNIQGSPFGDFGVTTPIPKALFDLDSPQKELDGFEMLEDTEIEIPLKG